MCVLPVHGEKKNNAGEISLSVIVSTNYNPSRMQDLRQVHVSKMSSDLS